MEQIKIKKVDKHKATIIFRDKEYILDIKYSNAHRHYVELFWKKRYHRFSLNVDKK